MGSAMVGNAVLMAHSFGAGHPRRAGGVMWHSSVGFLGVAVVMATVLAIWAAPIVGLFSDDAAVADAATRYLRVGSAAVPLLMATFLLNNLFTADKKAKYVLAGSAVTVVVNVVASATLIYGLGPLPELGVVGSAVGTVLAEAAALAVSAGLFVHQGYHRRIRPTSFRLSLRFIRSLLGLGWPTMLSVLFLHLAEFNTIRIAGDLGAAELAAIRTVNVMVFSTFALMTGFYQSGQVMAGRLLGADMWPRVRVMYRRNLELMVMAFLPLLAVYLAAPQLILQILTSDSAIIELGTNPFRIGAGALMITIWTLNTVVFIRGLGKTRWDLGMNAVSALAVQIPLAYLFTYGFGWGLIGVQTAALTFWLVRGLIGFGLLTSLLRRTSYKLNQATTLAEVFKDD